jgi:hypothetical protein
MDDVMADDITNPALAPRQFVHEKCGATSRMPDEMVAGYLANPHRYNDWAYCSKCDGFVPHRECRWSEMNESLDAYFGRLKAAVPAPPATAWLAYAAAPVIAAVGAGIGYGIGGGQGMWIGLFSGLGLGLLLVIARLIGLR